MIFIAHMLITKYDNNLRITKRAVAQLTQRTFF